MNSAELTALHTETITDLRRTRTLANITRRASRLFDDGYTANLTLNGLYVKGFQVLTPEGKRYSVKLSKTQAPAGSFFASKCTCKAFAEYDTCKHMEAIAMQDAQEAALEASWEAQEASDNGAYARY